MKNPGQRGRTLRGQTTLLHALLFVYPFAFFTQDIVVFARLCQTRNYTYPKLLLWVRRRCLRPDETKRDWGRDWPSSMEDGTFGGANFSRQIAKKDRKILASSLYLPINSDRGWYATTPTWSVPHPRSYGDREPGGNNPSLRTSQREGDTTGCHEPYEE